MIQQNSKGVLLSGVYPPLPQSSLDLPAWRTLQGGVPSSLSAGNLGIHAGEG
ncbi:hypothetical protein M0D69_43580 [Caballeronia sp. SEWSISQ10-4 2]|nr:hypothetical protein [Caballeronia sp. SEWSISQ10-4 2]